MPESNEKPIDIHSIGAGKVLLQAVWRDEHGNLYVKQAVGDGAVLCADFKLRANLIWSFVAAWISAMAATLNVDVAEIETDPMAEKSSIVRPDGQPYNATHGGRGRGSKSH